jgi:hypothetical protein
VDDCGVIDDARPRRLLLRGTRDITKAQVLPAPHALSCHSTNELLDSASQPTGASCFWHNPAGSLGRPSLRTPASPFAAERQFGGDVDALRAAWAGGPVRRRVRVLHGVRFVPHGQPSSCDVEPDFCG